MSSFTAGVIVIGDEILSGRTQDTNSNYIAKKLLEAGIKLEEVIVIQDHKKTIIENVLKYSSKYSYCLLYTSPSPRDRTRSRMPSSA